MNKNIANGPRPGSAKLSTLFTKNMYNFKNIAFSHQKGKEFFAFQNLLIFFHKKYLFFHKKYLFFHKKYQHSICDIDFGKKI